MDKSCRAFVMATVVAVVAAVPALAADKLPALGVDSTRTSISGLSSGAFMSVQYDVAFSASTIGVGVVAGGPYNCAWVNFGGINTCMQGSPSPQASYDAAVGFAMQGQIDPVENLARGRVYVFSGTNDSVVKPSAAKTTAEFFKAAKVDPAALRFDSTVPAGHAFLSPSFGNICATNAAPYVNQCAGTDGAPYDQPGVVLSHIYGKLAAKATTLSSQPVAFDQGEFTSAMAGMADTGYVYVPAACQGSGAAKCAVHVVFHGCQQGASVVGDDVYAKTGYNQWADSNNIVVLYPQVSPTTIPLNPQGCWDWWGYSGLNFQVKSAPQLSAVKAMVDRLTSGR